MFKHVRSVADSNAKGIKGSLSGIGRNVVLLGGTILGVRSAIDAAFRGVKLFADMESTTASFEVLIGNAEQAHKTLADLQRFALDTPFQLPELLEAAKMMSAFGEEAENLVPTIRMLGEVSAGLQVNLKDLAYIFGTLKAQGRAFTIDIRQFAMRGIPIYLELAKVLGLVGKEAKKVPRDVMDALAKMIEKGDIDFDVVEKAFKNMTGPGGKFFGQLEAQMKTLPGLFNMMKEEIDITLRTLGGVIVEGFNLREIIKQVSVLSEAFNKWLSGLSAETKRAIVIIASLVGIFVALTAVITVAGILFSLLFSWAGLVALAITGLVAITYAWVDSVGGLDRAWRKVKRAATDFWNFIKPLGPLLMTLFTPFIGGIILLVQHWDEVSAAVTNFWREAQPVLRAAWSLIKFIAFGIRDLLVGAFDKAWEAVKALGGVIAIVFQKIVGDSDLTWQKVRDGLRDFIIGAEYVLRNFGQMWEIVQFIALANFIRIRNFAVYVLRDAIPAYILYFVDVWKRGFTAALVLGINFMESLVKVVKTGIEKLPDIIAGKFNFSDILVDEMKEFGKKADGIIKGVLGEGPIIPKRLISIEEKEAFELVEHMRQMFKAGFRSFKEQKLLGFLMEDVADIGEELGLVMQEAFENMKEVAAVAGSDSGTSFVEHFQAAAKFDAALFDSAEARSRMEAFRDALLPQRERERARNASFSQPAPASTPNVAELQAVELLKKLVENTAALVANQAAPLVPAALPP